MDTTTKRCRACGTDKPLAEFSPMGRYVDGGVKYRPECRPCRRALDAKRRAEAGPSLCGLDAWQRMNFEDALAAVDAVLERWQPLLGAEIAQSVGNARTMLRHAVWLLSEAHRADEERRRRCR